ncbi:MAG TPA: MATE family efflux transporter [Caulobacteraceae bacterium]|jgi:MATE family multidrug resistance protein|nr:MATE family efflux transporter [Caulobacteraceae bacterium]
MSLVRRDLAELVRLAVPIVTTRLGVMAMGLTDTVVVGRYSSTELGYMALGWAPTAVVLTTGMGLLSGVQVMTARRVGEGRGAEAGAVLRRGLADALVIGAGSTLLLLVLGPAFLQGAGMAPDLAEGAARVLRIFSLSMTVSMLGVVCSSWLEALGRPRQAMAAMWFANAANLAVDLLVVPGRFGFPALGAAGAGWATFAARLVLLAVLVAYIARDAAGRAALLAKPPRDRAAQAEQRRIGYGAGAAFFVESGAFAGMNIVAGWVGGLAVAGWAVVLNVASIIFMLPLGIAMAASVLVARAHGAGDWAGVARAGKLGFTVAAALAAVVSLGLWPGAALVAGGYSTDPALIRIAAGALQLACLFLIADALQAVAAQALRACADVLVSTGVQIASYAAVMLPLGWALALPAGLGLAGIIWAVIAASLMSGALLVARFFWVARP